MTRRNEKAAFVALLALAMGAAAWGYLRLEQKRAAAEKAAGLLRLQAKRLTEENAQLREERAAARAFRADAQASSAEAALAHRAGAPGAGLRAMVELQEDGAATVSAWMLLLALESRTASKLPHFAHALGISPQQMSELETMVDAAKQRREAVRVGRAHVWVEAEDRLIIDVVETPETATLHRELKESFVRILGAECVELLDRLEPAGIDRYIRMLVGLETRFALTRQHSDTGARRYVLTESRHGQIVTLAATADLRLVRQKLGALASVVPPEF